MASTAKVATTFVAPLQSGALVIASPSTTVTLGSSARLRRAHAASALSISKVMTLPPAPTMNAASAAPYPDPGAELRERIAGEELEQAVGEEVGVRRTDGRKPVIVQGKGRVVRASLDVLGADEAFARDLEKRAQVRRIDGARVPHHRFDQRQAAASRHLAQLLLGKLRHLPPERFL